MGLRPSPMYYHIHIWPAARLEDLFGKAAGRQLLLGVWSCLLFQERKRTIHIKHEVKNTPGPRVLCSVLVVFCFFVFILDFLFLCCGVFVVCFVFCLFFYKKTSRFLYGSSPPFEYMVLFLFLLLSCLLLSFSPLAWPPLGLQGPSWASPRGPFRLQSFSWALGVLLGCSWRHLCLSGPLLSSPGVPWRALGPLVGSLETAKTKLPKKTGANTKSRKPISKAKELLVVPKISAST